MKKYNLDKKIFKKPTNIYDDMKMRLLKKAYDKYELEELMKKLDIKYNEF